MRHFRHILVFCAMLTLFTISAQAYSPDISQGQENIVKRARQLSEIEWTPLQDIYQWNYEGVFKAGVTYKGIPYGQPVNTNGYIGWSVDLNQFSNYTSDNTSKLYSSYSWYNKIAPYYSSDCSGYLSYAWQSSLRLTTTSLTDYAQKVSDQSANAIQVGDALNNASRHVVLVSKVDLDANGKAVGIEVMEQLPAVPATTGYGTLGNRAMSAFQSRFFSSGYVLYRNPNRDSVTYSHVCAVPIDGDRCGDCRECAPVSSIAVTGMGRQVTLTHKKSNAQIYYTTDGSTPTESSKLYSGTISIDKTTIVKAIAVTSDFENQSVLICNVAIEPTAAPVGKITEGIEDGNKISVGSKLTLSTSTSGAAIYYTTDGSTPTVSSAKYSSPITINSDMTVQAIAVKDGYGASSVSSFPFTVAEVYTIDISSSSGGSVSPRGITKVFSGADLTIKITADYQCTIETITVDGATAKAGDQYSFKNISSNHTVYVKFKDNISLPFTDVPSASWYRPAVSYAYKESLFNGTTSTAFSPETKMTRGMFVTVLSRLAGVSANMDGELAVISGSEVRLRAQANTTSEVLGHFDMYTPVSVVESNGDWHKVTSGSLTGWIRGDLLWIYDGRITGLPEGEYYTNAVKWACVLGIAGSSGGDFRASDSILRQDMAVMLYNYANAFSISITSNGSSGNFTDSAQISSYATDAVYALRNAGIISGMGDGSFSPTGTASRAQVAQIFLNFYDMKD